MEKRLFIAVMLSVAFLFGWAALLPRVFPDLAKTKQKPAAPAASTSDAPATSSVPDPAATAPAPGQSVPPMPPAAVPLVPAQSAAGVREIVIERPEFVARFTNRGAQMTSFRLKQYKDIGSSDLVELVRPRPAQATDYPFALLTADPALTRRVNEALYVVDHQPENGLLTFRYSEPPGISVTKTFAFKEPYRFDFGVEMPAAAPPYRLIVGPGIRKLRPDEEESRYTRNGNAMVQRDGEFEIVPREKAPALQIFPAPVEFVGIEDNYFLTVLQPSRGGEATVKAIALPGAKEGEPRKELYAGINAVQGQIRGKGFFGPRETELLDSYGLGNALQFGFFGPIARGLLWALEKLFTYTGNYGWAIIVLTIIIKILLYPLQHKSIVSMKKMQKLQPKMNAIRDKYKKAKSDPEQRQKMNVEMMKLYQQEKINPAGGCLPILLQLPILWAFYSLLSVAIELRGAEFMLWIQDLSSKDPYYITPILMTVTMFIQTWMTPTTADPTQRKVFLAMPFIFGWIFKEMPSGLVLYWLVQNILSIIQQTIMNKYWKDHPDPPAGPGKTKAA